MSEPLNFDYYYGVEAEQFSFYRVPRLLIKDERFKGLSSDAKLLYGLMLDRMALSMKNGWFDEADRAYVIYTIDNIREDLGCSKEKAVKVLAELSSNKGIGLVEKKHRGLGKPDIIYVKNFASLPENESEKEPANTDDSAEVGKTDFKRSEKPTSRSQENRLQEVGKTDSSRSEKLTSRSRENQPQEVGITDPNYNNTNYNDQNYTDMSYTNPINQSAEDVDSPDMRKKADMIDLIDDTNAYMEQIRDNLEYEHHMKYDSYGDREIYEEIYETVCDVVCVKRRTIRINGEDYPYELVKSRFLKLNSSHAGYVMDCMKDNVKKITNIRAYLITALYNAPSTMSHYYQQEVRHDMYGGGWEEKGIT
ncbi:MAG: replication initiator protein A [Lachnospiraceae bacterium]|nr:replication initiator protein A [Muribaculum sp.]MCM1410849.1 replication initiator protein A [Lachnospiraceae bacterium]